MNILIVKPQKIIEFFSGSWLHSLKPVYDSKIIHFFCYNIYFDINC